MFECQTRPLELKDHVGWFDYEGVYTNLLSRGTISRADTDEVVIEKIKQCVRSEGRILYFPPGIRTKVSPTVETWASRIIKNSTIIRMQDAIDHHDPAALVIGLGAVGIDVRRGMPFLTEDNVRAACVWLTRLQSKPVGIGSAWVSFNKIEYLIEAYRKEKHVGLIKDWFESELVKARNSMA